MNQIEMLVQQYMQMGVPRADAVARATAEIGGVQRAPQQQVGPAGIQGPDAPPKLGLWEQVVGGVRAADQALGGYIRDDLDRREAEDPKILPVTTGITDSMDRADRSLAGMISKHYRTGDPNTPPPVMATQGGGGGFTQALAQSGNPPQGGNSSQLDTLVRQYMSMGLPRFQAEAQAKADLGQREPLGQPHTPEQGIQMPTPGQIRGGILSHAASKLGGAIVDGVRAVAAPAIEGYQGVASDLRGAGYRAAGVPWKVPVGSPEQPQEPPKPEGVLSQQPPPAAPPQAGVLSQEPTAPPSPPVMAQASARPSMGMAPIPKEIAARRDTFMPLFQQVGQETGIDPKLLEATAWAESSFNPKAKSHANAQGMMQFIPGTAKRYGVDPWDPESSIRGSAAYYTDLLKMFKGDQSKAIAAYNWGEGNVQEAIAKYGDNWLAHAPEETKAHVAKINSYMGSEAGSVAQAAQMGAPVPTQQLGAPGILSQAQQPVTQQQGSEMEHPKRNRETAEEFYDRIYSNPWKAGLYHGLAALAEVDPNKHLQLLQDMDAADAQEAWDFQKLQIERMRASGQGAGAAGPGIKAQSWDPKANGWQVLGEMVLHRLLQAPRRSQCQPSRQRRCVSPRWILWWLMNP
ncbi:MAG: lytic transglycosylase domain-containing protein [Candidatus Competibacteraceae bacterium]|nr:lytic transglycosylase domain-containing protein [Candidatus Competibacteraceae bacterium]